MTPKVDVGGICAGGVRQTLSQGALRDLDRSKFIFGKVGREFYRSFPDPTDALRTVVSRTDQIADTEHFHAPYTGGGFNPSPRGETGRGLLGDVCIGHWITNREIRKAIRHPIPDGLARKAGSLPQDATAQAFAKPLSLIHLSQ